MAWYLQRGAGEKVLTLTLPMVPVRQTSAEVLFGSAARGDADALSDRDVLIVDDNIKRLTERSAELQAQGASVASYTFAKLAALADKGALFVQHLKLEGLITRDEGGRLSRLLNGFRPRANYSSEIAENAKLSALAGMVPAGSRGLLLAADILYVSVRNHGVLSLAERGVHLYAFDAVAFGLETAGLIETGGARALRALRFLKCLYRSGETGRGDAVRSAIETALGVLPSESFPRQIRVVPPLDLFSIALPTDASAYVVLRDLERRLVALETLGYEIGRDEELARLRRWICNPRAYATTSHRLAPEIRELISGFAALHASGRRASIG